jgi:hypothetical protein
MMRAFWKWLKHRPAIGLVIDQEQIAMSVVVGTLMGRQEIARDLQDCGGEPVETVLRRMLEPWVPPNESRKAKFRPWVLIGIPESRVFQATVAVTPANRVSTPQNFFLEAVQATNLRAEDRIIDLLKFEFNKQQLACLTTAPRVQIIELAEMLSRLGTRVAVIEPVPMGLLRAAVSDRPPPRGTKLSVRFFLGQGRAIGVEVAGSRPLFWHDFDLSPGQESASILTAYSTLWMLGRHSKVGAPIDTVFIHGRPDLSPIIEPETFKQRTGARLIYRPGPGYDLASAAMGVALNNPLDTDDGHNLVRELKPEVGIREIFPWAELIVQGALTGGISLLLAGAAADVDTRSKSARAETSAMTWLKDQDQAKLESEKRSLEERIRTLDAFQKTRVSWSSQLRTIAVDTPETTIITQLTGDSEIDLGKGKSKKQLIVSFATPLSEDGAMPPEIDKFITELRDEPTILEHFPNIEVSGLRTATVGSSGKAAQYSVVCLPKTEVIIAKPGPSK